jgi:hypothetical protein
MLTEPTTTDAYDIPKCTICLEEMRSNLVALSCGHCFHHCCVRQHLERKSFCPNCRKISDRSDMRSLFFDLTQKRHEERKYDLNDFK